MNFGRTMRNFGHTLGGAAQSVGRTLGRGAQTAARGMGRFAQNTLVPGLQRFGQEMGRAAPGIIAGLAPVAGAAGGAFLGGPMGAEIGAQLGSGLGTAVNNLYGQDPNGVVNMGQSFGGAVNAALPPGLQGQSYGNMIQQGVDQYLPGMGPSVAGVAGRFMNVNSSPQQQAQQGVDTMLSRMGAPGMQGYAHGGSVHYPHYPSLKHMVQSMSY